MQNNLEMTKHIKNIVWLGDLGFPVGMANIQRVILLCKALYEAGIKTTVISKFGVHGKDAENKVSKKGVYQNIEYIYASGTPFRPDSYIKRNFLKLIGSVNQIMILYKLKKDDRIDAAILRTDRLHELMYYKFISKLLRFPLVFSYVEKYSSFESNKKLIKRIEYCLYENVGLKLMDGILPISDYLMDFVQAKAPKIPRLKIPMITDCSRFGNVPRDCDQRYFSFCGGATYLEIIVFVINSFEKIHDNMIHLYLVVNGSDNMMNKVRHEITKSVKADKIRLFSRLSDDDLNELFVNALGLLIPLRPSIQDKARFPHKLGEYLSTGNPVITNKFGELEKLFTDGENGLVANDYNIDQFAIKMWYILDNPEEARNIGKKGKQLAKKYFDYKIYGPEVKKFLEKVL